MYYVYVLQSLRDNNLYFGYTADLEKRVELHNLGKVKSTKNRKPFVLVYYEAYFHKLDATKREYEIKKGQQREVIKKRLKHSLSSDR